MSKIIQVKDIDLGVNAASQRESLESRVDALEKEVRRLGRALKKEATDEPGK